MTQTLARPNKWCFCFALFLILSLFPSPSHANPCGDIFHEPTSELHSPPQSFTIDLTRRLEREYFFRFISVVRWFDLFTGNLTKDTLKPLRRSLNRTSTETYASVEEYVSSLKKAAQSYDELLEFYLTTVPDLPQLSLRDTMTILRSLDLDFRRNRLLSALREKLDSSGEPQELGRASLEQLEDFGAMVTQALFSHFQMRYTPRSLAAIATSHRSVTYKLIAADQMITGTQEQVVNLMVDTFYRIPAVSRERIEHLFPLIADAGTKKAVFDEFTTHSLKKTIPEMRAEMERLRAQSKAALQRAQALEHEANAMTRAAHQLEKKGDDLVRSISVEFVKGQLKKVRPQEEKEALLARLLTPHLTSIPVEQLIEYLALLDKSAAIDQLVVHYVEENYRSSISDKITLKNLPALTELTDTRKANDEVVERFFDRNVSRLELKDLSTLSDLVCELKVDDRIAEKFFDFHIEKICAEDLIHITTIAHDREARDRMAEKFLDHHNERTNISDLPDIMAVTHNRKVQDRIVEKFLDHHVGRLRMGDLSPLTAITHNDKTNDRILSKFLKQHVDHIGIDDLPTLTALTRTGKGNDELIKIFFKKKNPNLSIRDIEALTVLACFGETSVSIISDYVEAKGDDLSVEELWKLKEL